MDRLEVNPLYRDRLAAQGLTRAEDFLRLSGVIWCGHPARNVAHITLGEGDTAQSAFLKKEHRVPWKDRLINALTGFGLVANSIREARFLRTAAQTGAGCPEVIAAGEHKQRAFLLVREIHDAVDLRTFFVHESGEPDRMQLARKLGQAIAEMHKRGFVHRDLFSKHVLVHFNPTGERCIAFLDWQRARKLRRISWRQCFRELARLDATLADNLCGARERLTFLRAYLRGLRAEKIATERIVAASILFAAVSRSVSGKQDACRYGSSKRMTLSRAATTIRKISACFQRKRYVREMRQTPLQPGKQNLVWLDGEAVCVTKQFLELVERGNAAERVFTAQPATAAALDRLRDLQNHAQAQCRQIIHIDNRNDVEAVLVRRQESRFWSWLWRSLRRHSFTSKELALAATLFRLERFGVPVPKLLAVGQQFSLPWQIRSFILLQHAALPSLSAWRKQVADRETERSVLAQSAIHLQRIHEAGYFVAKGRDPLDIFSVSTDDDNRHTVVLRDPAALCRTGKG